MTSASGERLFCYLVKFDQSQSADDVHRRRVELEAHACGANVVADAEAALEDESQAQRVVDSKLLHHSHIRLCDCNFYRVFSHVRT